MAHIRHRKSISSLSANDTPLLASYWVAHLLSIPTVWKQGWCHHEKHFDLEPLLECVGLRQNVEGKCRTPPKNLTEFIESYSLDQLLAEDEIFTKLDCLGEYLGLSETEKRFLTFADHLHSNVMLYGAGALLEGCSNKLLVSYLASFIQCPREEISNILRPDGLLRTSRILNINLTNNIRHRDLTSILELQDDFADLLHAPDVSTETLTSLFYRPAEKPALRDQDFREMSCEVSLLENLLRNAVEQNLRSINILIYGPPGTGKTQLALLLAQRLGYPMATVPETDKDGEALNANIRLGRYMACQRVLERDNQTIVMFDEAEESLCDGPRFLFFASPRTTPKPGVIRALENNAKPTIWISNRSNMDTAFMRRFSHVVKIDNPGLHQRQRLVTEALKNTPVSDTFIQAAARMEKLSPAILHAGVQFAKLASNNDQDIETLLAHNLNARLEALGETHRLTVGGLQDLPWRAECLRASEDVASLINDIKPNTPARLCLYGPPGTGKTAWAKQLAEHIGQPLMVRQASDLMDMYVGETEKKIAEAFSQAARQNAVLLIDEADSFLSNRQNAQRSWEVSQVNQFLTSMEQYQGLFVATTNLLELVDDAAMRRFDFTIAFDYLDTDGVALLFCDLATAHGIDLPSDESLKTMLTGMEKLAPGDFTALHRRLHVRRQKPSANQLVTLLAELQARKSRHPRPIGFSAKLH